MSLILEHMSQFAQMYPLIVRDLARFGPWSLRGPWSLGSYIKSI